MNDIVLVVMQFLFHRILWWIECLACGVWNISQTLLADNLKTMKIFTYVLLFLCHLHCVENVTHAVGRQAVIVLMFSNTYLIFLSSLFIRLLLLLCFISCHSKHCFVDPYFQHYHKNVWKKSEQTNHSTDRKEETISLPFPFIIIVGAMPRS